ncbi:MAG: SulP family inorganic anion transporter [Magnetococcales bacterium]|nr:SulP family inorganic anion transporter [Magnetococcales bacterium]
MHTQLSSSVRWRAFLPSLQWWDRVTPATLRADLIAGLTGAIVVLPQGIAFAAIAGMPPVYGLYAGMVPAIVAALFGSSWHLVSGPTTAASIVLFSLLSVHAEPGSAAYVQLALTMTFLVGLTQLGLGLIRMGTLVNFISHSVVIGFTSGAALLIATNQLHNFFGIHIPRGTDFTQTLVALFQQLDQINPYILAVSLITLVVGIMFRTWFPRIPYMIAALAAGTFLALLIDSLISVPSGITRVSALSGSLPPLSMPDFSLSTLRTLAPGVIAVTLLALTEAISIARALALRSGQTIDSDQEFVAQGLSNLVGSFFSAYVATGSFNRSGLNYECGAKTPIAAASSGLMLIVLVTMVAPLAAYLPNAAMAGVLFLVAWGLIDWHHIHRTLHTSRSETIIMVATFLSTLFLNLEIAILFGVMLSLGIYLARTSHPIVIPRVPDPSHPHRRFFTPIDTPECPQVRLVRVDGSLFFAAISTIQEHFEQMASPQTHLIVVASGINFVDLSGAEFLALEASKRRAAGAGLYLVRLKERPYVLLERGGYLETIGKENLFASKYEAIAAVFRKLDHARCAKCPLYLFQECASVAKSDQPRPIPRLANQAA